MPTNEWTTPAQKRYVMSKLTAYIAATDIFNHKALHRFWVTLNEGWFELFPVQTTTSLVAIGDEIEKAKECLKTWMRYRAARRRHAASTSPSSGGGDGGRSSIGAALAGSSGGGRASKTRSLFSVLKRTKEICPYHPIEVYQKVYNLKISQEVMARGYGLLNEETETAAAAASALSSADIVILTDEKIWAAAEKETEAVEACIHKNHQLQMSMRRRAVIELYDAEDNEVKAEIKAEREAMNAEHVARAGGDTDESTPEDYQHICYGTTALSSDFQASHSSFDDSVKAHFNKFLKRAFPHNVHDARGIVDNSQEIAGAIAISDKGDDKTPAVGEASKSKPPKRIRHPKYATAAPAPGPAVPPAVLLPTSNVVSMPTDAADLSEPDAIADSLLPIPTGFEEMMDTIASEYGTQRPAAGVYQDTGAHAGDSLGLKIDLCRIISDCSSPLGNAQSTKLAVGAVLQPTPVSTNTYPPSSPLNALVVPLPTPLSTSTRPPVPSRALAFFSASLERYSQPRPSSAAPPTPRTPPSPPAASAPAQSSLEGEAAAPPGPHYIVSQPMANPPKAPAPAGSRPKEGRPGGGEGEEDANRESLATMWARQMWEESARIHREEAAQRKNRVELRKREKAMEEKEAVSTAAANHHCNPSGGADLVVVERPKRAVKAALNLDGTPVIRPVQRTRAELPGSQVAFRAKADAELLKRLNGKGKGKGKRKAEEAPAPKTRPTKYIFFLLLLWD
ncbi:hypothetical protein B0H14DRAFT_2611868 [Mycena olivaceomarginata]|nr:hypothetical protein B0H14DRAFT_2611868 [Mycena olivaceomarginata]